MQHKDQINGNCLARKEIIFSWNGMLFRWRNSIGCLIWLRGNTRILQAQKFPGVLKQLIVGWWEKFSSYELICAATMVFFTLRIYARAQVASQNIFIGGDRRLPEAGASLWRYWFQFSVRLDPIIFCLYSPMFLLVRVNKISVSTSLMPRHQLISFGRVMATPRKGLMEILQTTQI